MKIASQTATHISEKSVGNGAPQQNLLELPEVKTYFKNLKARKIYPPTKFVALVKENLQRHVRDSLRADPNYDLKKLMIFAISDFDETMPPRLFIEAVTWVAEEWQRCRQEIENLAPTEA